MNRILIADDEPLVQIGLRSMLSKGFDDIEIVGTAGNGEEALQLIDELRPDIVIADIKMPLKSGLDLLKESKKKYGPVPAFIMLTAYEEFDLVRQAISLQAVDYLVKIELDPESLHRAVQKAIQRIAPYRERFTASAEASAKTAEASLEEFRQKLLMRLLSNSVPSEKILKEEASRVQLPLDFNRYIAAYAVLSSSETMPENTQHDQRITLYSSCLSMTREIIERYAGCYFISNDPQHFTMIFYFREMQPIAAAMQQIQEALTHAAEMIRSYFSVPLCFGIGTAVSSAMNLPDSFEEAKSAAACADEKNPVRLFSHIVGARRRSGKDKMIAAIHQYIDENLGGKLQLNDVAREFGLSPAYLSFIFKKSSDVGFSEYVNSRKIEKAKELLLSDDMKIYEVADALGFESAFYFSKVFKKIEGVSPREFIARKSEE
jgi:two-component system, response regulator YesN